MNKYLMLGLAMLASSPIYCADGWSSDYEPLNDQDFALQFLCSGNADLDDLEYCTERYKWSPGRVTELLKYIPAICSACEVQEIGCMACPNPRCAEIYCILCAVEEDVAIMDGCSYCLSPLATHDERDAQAIDYGCYSVVEGQCPLSAENKPYSTVDSPMPDRLRLTIDEVVELENFHLPPAAHLSTLSH